MIYCFIRWHFRNSRKTRIATSTYSKTVFLYKAKTGQNGPWGGPKTIWVLCLLLRHDEYTDTSRRNCDITRCTSATASDAPKRSRRIDVPRYLRAVATTVMVRTCAARNTAHTAVDARVYDDRRFSQGSVEDFWFWRQANVGRVEISIHARN